MTWEKLWWTFESWMILCISSKCVLKFLIEFLNHMLVYHVHSSQFQVLCLTKCSNKILQFLEYKKYVVFFKKRKIKYTAWKNTYIECVFQNEPFLWTFWSTTNTEIGKSVTQNMIQQKRNTFINSFVVHFVESFPFEHPHFKSLS